MSKRLDPNKVDIVCKNLAERSAALRFLAALVNLPIYEGCFKDEWSEADFKEFPNVAAVGAGGDEVCYVCDEERYRDEDRCYIPFAQLWKLAPSKAKPVNIKLNDSYEAVITQDLITVGCQEFSWDVVRRLSEGIEEFKDQ